MKLSNVAVYTEDAPVSEEKLASGMCRVNNRLFRVINSNIDNIYIGDFHSKYSFNDFDSDIIKKLHNRNLLISSLCKVRRHMNKIFSKLGVRKLEFFIESNDILKSIKDNKSRHVFSPIGADIKSYERAVIIAKKTSLPLTVYLVDDFSSYRSMIGGDKERKDIENKFEYLLSQTENIFVISSGFKKHLKDRFNVDSKILNLPYNKRFKISEKNESRNEILFLGNVSKLYNQGLVDLLNVLIKINKERSENIKLRLTYDENHLPSFLNEFREHIVLGRVPGEENLAKVIASSLCCFIPYSFSEEMKTMVSTSFPSKTLECLAYSKRLLIYSPNYGTVSQYCTEHRIGTIVNHEDLEKLENSLLSIIGDKVDESYSYNKILEEIHSYKSVESSWNSIEL